MRAAGVAAALLAGCAAAPEPGDVALAVLPNVPSYTAAKGEIMVLGQAPAVESARPGYTALTFVGMRSATQAVFTRTRLDAPPGPVRQTEVPGLLVPVRSGAPNPEAALLPPGPVEGEIVLEPALGALFGVDDIVLLVTQVGPGAISYQLDDFDPVGQVVEPIVARVGAALQ